MPSTLIIIGHDDRTRLNLEPRLIAQSGGLNPLNCPGCQIGGGLVQGRSTRTLNFGQSVLAFSADSGVKPAEFYMIPFAQQAQAETFIASTLSVVNNDNRTVLLLDTAPTEPYKPWLMVIVGRDPCDLLNASPPPPQVVIACPGCQITKVVVFGEALGAADGSPPQCVLTRAVGILPAEIHVLGFDSEADAVSFAQANLARPSLPFKTVLLFDLTAQPAS